MWLCCVAEQLNHWQSPLQTVWMQQGEAPSSTASLNPSMPGLGPKQEQGMLAVNDSISKHHKQAAADSAKVLLKPQL